MREETRHGMALAKQLIEEIQAADIDETTGEYDLQQLADSIERTIHCEKPEVRRGVCLALADYLTAASGPDVDSWRPCLAPDGRSLLLRPVL